MFSLFGLTHFVENPSEIFRVVSATRFHPERHLHLTTEPYHSNRNNCPFFLCKFYIWVKQHWIKLAGDGFALGWDVVSLGI